MRHEQVVAVATSTWEQWQSKRSQYEKFGNLPSIVTATMEEVVAHFVFCNELSEQNRVTVDPMRWWGKGHEEIEQFVAGRVSQENRRAGVKAVVRKYGKDGAERIIEKHTGRHINLR